MWLISNALPSLSCGHCAFPRWGCAGRPVLLHLVRRYSCSIDRERARELSLLKPALDNYGVQMVAVGRGSLGLDKWIKGGYWHGKTYYEPEQESPVSKALLLSETTNVWGLFAPKVRTYVAEGMRAPALSTNFLHCEAFSVRSRIYVLTLFCFCLLKLALSYALCRSARRTFSERCWRPFSRRASAS